MPVRGTQQSPIKIETAKANYAPVSASYLKFNYSKPLHGKIIAAKKIFLFDPPPKEVNALEWSITVGGVTWFIRQTHMHAKAEHLVDSDTPKPFEAHLVHTLPNDPDGKGDKLVVSVFIRPGIEKREKRSLDKFIKAYAKQAADSSEPTEVDPRDLLPDSGLDKFFRYEGSLTGQPFTEDVSWYVMLDDGVVDPTRFEALAKYAEQERREPQFLNRRFVLRSFES